MSIILKSGSTLYREGVYSLLVASKKADTAAVLLSVFSTIKQKSE